MKLIIFALCSLVSYCFKHDFVLFRFVGPLRGSTTRKRMQ